MDGRFFLELHPNRGILGSNCYKQAIARFDRWSTSVTAIFRQLTGHLVLNWFDDMTVEETSCFKLLDGYSRSQHGWFLAEMFPNAAGTNYTLCFRPTGGSKDSPNRYACRYLHIGAEEVRTAGHMKVLPPSIAEMLDTELPKVAKS